jgi:hypothetical protein
MWLSAIVSLFFFQVWKPHSSGEVLPKFLVDVILLLFFLQELSRSTPVTLVCLHRVASPLHRPATAPLA